MAEYGAPSRWIWMPGWKDADNNETRLALFRRVFSLDQAQYEKMNEECLVRISADTRYKLYVNGRLVEFGPAKGDDKIWYYDTVNIGPFLVADVNAIAVEVLHYPPVHGKGNHSLFRTTQPGLYFEEITADTKEPVRQIWEDLRKAAVDPAGGGRIGISADSRWHVHMVEHFEIFPEPGGFTPIYMNENAGGCASTAGWRLAAYDESSDVWEPAYVYNATVMDRSRVPGNLLPRTIPYMYRKPKQFAGIQEIRQSSTDKKKWEKMLSGKGTVSIPADTTEIIEISAGEEECGFLSLAFAKGAGAKISILCSESYAYEVKVQADGQQHPQKGDRTDSKNGRLSGMTDYYEAAGYGTADEPEFYEPFFFRTFRFVQLKIETKDEPMELLRFDYEETGYPLEVKAAVETSDESLAKIWDISERTLRRCMHETYMDCPFYEQLQYAMDARSQILYTYSISGDDRLARRCMEDFRRSQRYDYLLNCSYPNYEVNVIPGFSIYYILMLYDHMMYFGDRTFLRRHMSCMDSILEYFDRHLEPNGLVKPVGGVLGESRYWEFIDWTSQWNDTAGVPSAVLSGDITMDSLLYLMGLQAAAEVARFIGRGGTAEEYEGRAEELKASVLANCVNKDGMITDGPGLDEISQQAQVFAILTGTVSTGRGREYLKRTLDDTQRYAQCSVAMAWYLFRALEMTGLYEYTDRLWDIWRGMLKNKLTTCVEDGVTGRSDCHAWGALALYELPSAVLGVRPAAPGYERIQIRPMTGLLKKASGTTVTKHGLVNVVWHRDKNGNLKLDYTAPKGVEIEL